MTLFRCMKTVDKTKFVSKLLLDDKLDMNNDLASVTE